MTVTKTFTDVEIKSADLGQIEAVFATFDVIDLDGDVTRKGAFTEGAPVVISAYGHTSWDGALPIGKGTIHEVGDKAVMRGEFFLDTTHGRDAWNTIKNLTGVQEWSYSLHDVVCEPGVVDGKSVRILKAIAVKEVSPVLRGAAGAGRTGTLSTKDAPTKFSEHVAIALGDVKAFVEMALERLTQRAEAGKSIDEQRAAYDELIASVAPLKAAIDELDQPETEVETPPSNDDAVREYLRFVAISQGVTS